MGPEIEHHPLSGADGSATFVSELCSVLAAVNGPIEVQRRDELSDQAAIEVNVLAASGASSPRERWMESMIASVLREIILVQLHPRTLIQVTLQITKGITTGKTAVRDLALLPGLLNAAFLALVDAGVPLGMTVTAVLVGIAKDKPAVVEPTEKEISGCQSVHVFAYSQQGALFLNESTGRFSIDEWDTVAQVAEQRCASVLQAADEDVDMRDEETRKAAWMRAELEERANDQGAWRQDT